jgi:hypothetical protein
MVIMRKGSRYGKRGKGKNEQPEATAPEVGPYVERK